MLAYVDLDGGRPGNLTQAVTFYVESDVEVQITQILYLNLKYQEKRTYTNLYSKL